MRSNISLETTHVHISCKKKKRLLMLNRVDNCGWGTEGWPLGREFFVAICFFAKFYWLFTSTYNIYTHKYSLPYRLCCAAALEDHIRVGFHNADLITSTWELQASIGSVTWGLWYIKKNKNSCTSDKEMYSIVSIWISLSLQVQDFFPVTLKFKENANLGIFLIMLIEKVYTTIIEKYAG